MSQNFLLSCILRMSMHWWGDLGGKKWVILVDYCNGISEQENHKGRITKLKLWNWIHCNEDHSTTPNDTSFFSSLSSRKYIFWPKICIWIQMIPSIFATFILYRILLHTLLNVLAIFSPKILPKCFTLVFQLGFKNINMLLS